jgi:hypothetical protein
MKRAALLILLAAFSCAPALAQQARLDEILPARTSFYIYWQGAASLEAARAANPLLRLLSDPEFAAARSQVYASLQAAAPGNAARALEAAEFNALLGNQLLVGSLELPRPAAPLARPGQPAPSPADNTFLIFDATGVRPRLEELLASFRPAEKSAAVTRSAFAGTTIETFGSGAKKTFRAMVGDLLVEAGRREVIEPVIRAVALADAAGPRLGDSQDYKRARQAIGAGASVEFFMRLKELIPSPAGQRAAQDAAMWRVLGLERLEILAGGITFAPGHTRVRASLLGDTSAGSLFDLAGSSVPTFMSLRAAPRDVVSYGVNIFDLAAAYQLIMKAAGQAAPGAAQGPAASLDRMVEQSIGMTPLEALKLFSGEFAAFTTGAGLELDSNLYFIGIRRQQDAVYLVRTLLASQITSETVEGNITFFALTWSYADAKTQALRKRFFHVAVAPQAVLVGPRKAMLREMLASLAAPQDQPAGLAADARFRAACSRLPQLLSGFGYSHLSRMPWESLALSAAQEAAQATPAVESEAGAKQPPRTSIDWKKLLSPSVLSKYLHAWESGWWKDAAGLHFDACLE